MIKVGYISHLHPTALLPHQGKFIQDQLKLLNSQKNIIADLIVPTPYSFPGTERHKKNNSKILNLGYDSYRLFYLSFPKQLLPKVIRRSISKKINVFIKNNDYDIIHINWIYPDGLIAPELQKFDCKTLLTTHGSDWFSNKNKPNLISIIEKILNAIDQIIYVGPDLKDDIETFFPSLHAKSKIIFNSVDPDIYSPPSTKEKKNAKNRLFWGLNKKHALTVANIKHEKGIDILVKTVSNNSKLKDIEFHIVGKLGVDDFSKEVYGIAKNSIYDNIHFYDPVEPNALIEFYHASDFYISPSRREGFGLALTEACFTGLPFIADSVGIAPMLHQLKCGSLLDIYNFNDLDLVINKLSKTISKADRDNLIKLFGTKNTIESLINTYKLLLNDVSEKF